MAVYQVNGKIDNVLYVMRVLYATWRHSYGKDDWDRRIRLIPRIRMANLKHKQEMEISALRKNNAELHEYNSALDLTTSFDELQMNELNKWCIEQMAARQFGTQPFVDKVREISKKAA